MGAACDLRSCERKELASSCGKAKQPQAPCSTPGVRPLISIQCLIILVLHVAASGVGAVSAEPEPLVVAHRGLLRHAPENTLANFRACLELRVGFEFDVQRTKDGVLICIHDDTVQRTTNGNGRLAELTLPDIRTLDAGAWYDRKFAGEKVPTVEEVLKLVSAYRQHDVLIAVDLKADRVAADVADLAEQHGVLNRLLFIGRTISDPQVREEIAGAARTAHAAAVANDASEFSKALDAPDADWVYFRYLPSVLEMKALQTANKRSFVAGPAVAGDLPENWQQAADLGIDAILTDHPLKLRSTLRTERSQ